MNPKATIYSLFLIGCIALIAIWAYALSVAAEPLRVVLASIATLLLCIVSSMITAKKIRGDSRLSIETVVSSARLIAAAPAFMGICVLIWEHIPSRSGAGSLIDRRYAFLFFSMVTYLFLFPYLTARKVR